MEEIVNRVANSKLVTVNLEEFYPQGKRILFDIKDWLFEGLVLREKEFRTHAEAHNWESYQDSYVALHCSTEAIVPAWAYLLLTSKLMPYAKKVVVGNLSQLETVLYTEIIQDLDIEPYQDKPLIIKGCSHAPVPDNAYMLLLQKLQPVAKSIMYGEACSSVPVFKRKKLS